MGTPSKTRTATATRGRPRGSISAGTEAPDRKRDILLAAERLFAEHGFHGVAIRDIANEAGVQFALVGYYYGPKLDLYQEIFRQRSGYIQERLNSLARAQAGAPRDQLLEEIVKAFVLPVLKMARDPDGRNFLRLIQRGMDEQLKEDEPMIRTMFDPLALAFIDAFAAAIPGATPGTAACCYQFAFGAMLHHISDKRIERLSRGEFPPISPEAAPLLVKFITSGMRGMFADAVH
ncbi:MAG TPA: TetR family transcriptional regulator [Burkholderiaceae bacterium]|nr:TetR family transcriptional regulator [Burkholderiaceae bacterium]